MGVFPYSSNNVYILFVVNYISKWNESKDMCISDVMVVVDCIKTQIFDKFGIIKANNQSKH